MKIVLLLVLAVVTLSTGFGFPSKAASMREQGNHEILLRFNKEYAASDASDLLSRIDLTAKDYFSQIDVWLVTSLEISSVSEALAKLRQRPEIAWAEENGTVHIQAVTPNDNFYWGQQENLRVIGLPTAWMSTTGGNVVIAVIDTGIDLDHPDLEEKIWKNSQEISANEVDDDLNGYIDDDAGWDFVNEDNIPQDDQSHGSHVAGIAGAHTDNVIGMAGVSWGVRLMALKALNHLGDGTWADVAEAILYASDNEAQVLNMSFGDADASQTIELAVEYAASQGCLLVAAAGNGGVSVFYPAAFPEVVAVSATNNQDLPWSQSNRGPEVEIAAPGVDIFSTNAYDSYTILSGTSMATPHVSGVASLIWSVAPELSPIQVTNILTNTAVDVWSPGYDQLTGWGRVSASQAVEVPGIDITFLPVILAVGDD